MTADARALARASGAAQRAYGPVTALVAITASMGGHIALHGTAVVEALDLLRFYLREETLRGIIEPKPAKRVRGPSTADRVKASEGRVTARSASAAPPTKWPGPISRSNPQAKGGHARAAKLAPARRKAIAKAAAQARWGK